MCQSEGAPKHMLPGYTLPKAASLTLVHCGQAASTRLCQATWGSRPGGIQNYLQQRRNRPGCPRAPPRNWRFTCRQIRLRHRGGFLHVRTNILIDVNYALASNVGPADLDARRGTPGAIVSEADLKLGGPLTARALVPAAENELLAKVQVRPPNGSFVRSLCCVLATKGFLQDCHRVQWSLVLPA